MDDTTRRSFCRRAGAGALAGGLAIGAAGSARAWHDDTPANVTIEYDRATLERYRPRLVMPTESRQKLLGCYGWVARSPDYDTAACIYWLKYTHQSGLLGNLDSHFGDHEPAYVYFDTSTGEVTRVLASVYHWLKGEVSGELGPDSPVMWDDSHAHLRVLQPWHQYTAPSPADDGRFVDVKDLTSALDTWLANGLEDSLFLRAVTSPWTMRNRPHWWQDTLAGLSLNAQIVRTARAVGHDQVGDLEA